MRGAAKLRNGCAENRMPLQLEDTFRQFGRELLDKIRASLTCRVGRGGVFRDETKIAQKTLVGVDNGVSDRADSNATSILCAPTAGAARRWPSRIHPLRHGAWGHPESRGEHSHDAFRRPTVAVGIDGLCETLATL